MEHPKDHHVRLTRREQELVAEILAGRTNKAIAHKFGVKEQTVRNQLTVLFRKLGVASRLELAVKIASRAAED
jgi:two-component system nitrate/nitrite response regulator NarL